MCLYVKRHALLTTLGIGRKKEQQTPSWPIHNLCATRKKSLYGAIKEIATIPNVWAMKNAGFSHLAVIDPRKMALPITAIPNLAMLSALSKK
jgi:hypothetical protein